MGVPQRRCSIRRAVRNEHIVARLSKPVPTVDMVRFYWAQCSRSCPKTQSSALTGRWLWADGAGGEQLTVMFDRDSAGDPAA
jgi:hypothetical protein